MKIIVTGSEGFIGSNLVESLLNDNHIVIGIDKVNRNRPFHNHVNFTFINKDIIGIDSGFDDFKNCDAIIHLAANSDISKSSFMDDYEDTFDSTVGTLALRAGFNIPKFIFTSSSAVFGTVDGKIKIDHPHNPETYYGGFKSACESVIKSDSFQKGFSYSIVRLANVVGGNYATHGVVYDLFMKLKANPKKLEVLGDGTQSKEYIHVDSIVDLIIGEIRSPSRTIQVGYINYNTLTVEEIVDYMCERLNVSPKITYTGKSWKGDVGFYSMEGTVPMYSSLDIKKTISELIAIYGGIE